MIHVYLNRSARHIQREILSRILLKKLRSLKKKRYLNYIVISTNKKIIFKKRTGDDIWKNLYDFPLIEGNYLKLDQITNKTKFIILTKKLKKPLKFIKVLTAKHQLSHQVLYIKFWLFFSEESLQNSVSIEEIINFPKPVVISDFINKHLKS